MNRALGQAAGAAFRDAAQMRRGHRVGHAAQRHAGVARPPARLAPLQQYAKPIWAYVLAGLHRRGACSAWNTWREHRATTSGSPAAKPRDRCRATTSHHAYAQAVAGVAGAAGHRRGTQAIAAGQLTTPIDANAYTSVLEAWNADGTNAEVIAVIAELTDAFANAIAAQVRDGNDARAREIHAMATALAEQTGTSARPRTCACAGRPRRR
jgi:predicted hotdog family 3-hydroxylacyl-ACP dehydratase